MLFAIFCTREPSDNPNCPSGIAHISQSVKRGSCVGDGEPRVAPRRVSHDPREYRAHRADSRGNERRSGKTTMLPPDMTHDLRCPLGVSAAETLQKILRELVAASNAAVRRFSRRDYAPARPRDHPVRVSPHLHHFSPDNSPCKAKKDHNSVYLRPTVVVSEGFRNLSVVLGRFRKARLVKPAFVARLTSGCPVRDCRAEPSEKSRNIIMRHLAT